MTWTLSTVIAEIFYCIIGLIFIGTGFKALKDNTCSKRVTTAAFWFILAATFIAGPYFPRWITGLCVVLMALLTAFNRVAPSKSDIPDAKETRAAADRLGYSVFIPPLFLALSAVLVATFLKSLGANNAIGISGIIALIAAFFIFRPKPVYAVKDCTRLTDNVGVTGILPQVLAALGAVFTAAGGSKRSDPSGKSFCSHCRLLYRHGPFYHDHGKWLCRLLCNHRRHRYSLPGSPGCGSCGRWRAGTHRRLLRNSYDPYGSQL